MKYKRIIIIWWWCAILTLCEGSFAQSDWPVLEAVVRYKQNQKVNGNITGDLLNLCLQFQDAPDPPQGFMDLLDDLPQKIIVVSEYGNHDDVTDMLYIGIIEYSTPTTAIVYTTGGEFDGIPEIYELTESSGVWTVDNVQSLDMSGP